MDTGSLPPSLPRVFSYAEARRRGISDRQLRTLSEQGTIEKIGRGVFSTATVDTDADLIEVAFRSAQATMCLTSALARHGLTDEIPGTIDMALPRRMRPPTTSAPVTWHQFDRRTFGVGREHLDVGAGYQIGIYSPERSICDAFRLRHLEGTEPATEALKNWLRRPGSQPSQLLKLATEMGPKAAQPIRSALQILL